MNQQLTRRNFIRALGGGAAALTLGHFAFSQSELPAKRPPNIVLIFMDDMGYGDLGCFGSKTVKTPNIDRLAIEGTKFTNFYVASSVCTPSRAALMTGCYPKRIGMACGVLFPNADRGLNPDEITLAEVLKQRGYTTACIGKWHLGDRPPFLPTRQGFDTYFGIPYSNDMARQGPGTTPDQLDIDWREKRYERYEVPLMRDEQVIEQPANQTTRTKRYNEEAVRFIEANQHRPFFLYLPHSMVHIPLFVSDDYYTQDPHEAYAVTMKEVDDGVGRILDTLNKLGLDEQTLVIFTSDNGPWLPKKHHGGSAGPLRDGKGTTWEGGQRVPGIFRWPGHIPQGKVCHELATSMDMMPTLAGLAGGQAPTDRVIDGKDIRSLLTNPQSARTPHEFFCYYTTQGELSAIRSGNWKLRFGENQGLFDLEADIGETTDVAAQHPDIVKRLTQTAHAFDEKLTREQRPIGRLG